MLAGEPYTPSDDELAADHLHAQVLLEHLNESGAADELGREHLLLQLCSHFGASVVLKPTFRCDYGCNISIGARSFINYGCVFFDCNTITIGEEVQTAPAGHIYTASYYTTSHSLDAATRRARLEYALPVVIGDGCGWEAERSSAPASA